MVSKNFDFETYEGLPLRKFKGRCTSARLEEREGGFSGKFAVAYFDFVELEVIRTMAPYDLPTTSLNIPYSKNANTRFGALATAVKEVTGQADPMFLVNKVQTWEMLPWKVNRQDRETREWREEPIEAWRLVSIEGVDKTLSIENVPAPISGAAVSTPPTNNTPSKVSMETLVLLVDGKTDSEFVQMALQDTEVKADQALVTRIVEREVLPQLETAGLIERDDQGIWHSKS